MLFLDALLLGMRHGSTIMPQKANKHQSMEWKHITSPVRKKFRTQSSVAKAMLTLLLGRDAQGPILEHYQDKGTTVNSVL
jgi:uracil DNA glycosylase